MVDGVCEFCTGLEKSRIDSCCPQATSSACFDQFAGANAAQTEPASAMATPTATSTGGLSLTPTSSANSGVIAKVRPKYMIVMDTKLPRIRISLAAPLSYS
jgi:hypothetical protein